MDDRKGKEHEGWRGDEGGGKRREEEEIPRIQLARRVRLFAGPHPLRPPCRWSARLRHPTSTA